MKRTELDDWCRANWDRIPGDKRRACVDHIRPKFNADDLANLCVQHAHGERLGHDWAGFHLLMGMQVRNALRDVLLDADLPVVVQKDGSTAQNWDDFYTGALEQMCEEENSEQ